MAGTSLAIRLRKLLETLPRPLAASFAYGSYVFPQKSPGPNRYPEDSLVDLIIAVDEPASWHVENLNRNPSHYSFLAMCYGGTYTSHLQQLGAGVYYNPYIDVPKCSEQDHAVQAKYGIIGTERLKSDLINWDTLYIAGRVHKPIHFITPENSVSCEIRSAIYKNRRAAAHLILLIYSSMAQQAKSVPISELLEAIVGISYSGDIRTFLEGFEDPLKVSKIAKFQGHLLREIYVPHFKKASEEYPELLKLDIPRDCVTFSANGASDVHEAQQKILSLLPKNFVETHLIKFGGRICDNALRSAASDIVSRYSWLQAAKGVHTAGLFKSIRYMMAKFRKATLMRS